MEPLHALPSSQPWPLGDPRRCLYWHLQATCSHRSRLPEQEELRRALPQMRGQEQSDRQDPMSHSSLFSLPLWPYLTTCQNLFKHWATPSHKDPFHFLESKECLPWFPESQMQVSVSSSRHSLQIRGLLSPPPPEGPTTPKIKSSTLKKNKNVLITQLLP